MAPLSETTFASDNYNAPSFENTGLITTIHLNIPRASFDNNVTKIIGDDITNQEDSAEYVKGVLFAPLTLDSILLLWGGLLLLFKCLGRDRVGCLSGSPLERPKPSSGLLDKCGTKVEGESSHAFVQEESNKIPSDSKGDDDIKLPNNDLLEESGTEEKSTEMSSDPRDDPASLAMGDIKSFNSIWSGESICFDQLLLDIEGRVKSTITGVDIPVESTSDLDKDAKECDSSGVNHLVTTPLEIMSKADVEKWKRDTSRVNRFLLPSRILVLFSCFAIIAISIVFTLKGFQGLSMSLDNATYSLNDLEEITTSAIASVDDYQVHKFIALEDTQKFLRESEEFCSKSENDLIKQCMNAISKRNNIFDDALPEECSLLRVVRGIASLSESLPKLRERMFQEATILDDDLHEILGVIADAQHQTKKFYGTFYSSLAAMVLLDCMIFLVSHRIFLLWMNTPLSDKCRWVQNYFVPLLSFSVVLVIIFGSIFISGTTVASDFCYDSPDKNIKLLVEKDRDSFSNYMTALIQSWTSGCADMTENSLSSRLDEAFAGTTASILSIHQTLSTLEHTNQTRLTSLCGKDVTSLAAGMSNLDWQYHALLKAIESSREQFFCSNWHSKIVSIVYDDLCFKGIPGFAWAFVSMYTISFCGMVILSLRFTMLEVEGIKLPSDVRTIEGSIPSSSNVEDEEQECRDYL